MFNSNSQTNFDGLSIPSLLPGKYEDVRLIKVEAGTSTKKDESSGKRILTFLFQTKDGQQHQRTEWDTDDEKKANNMTIRVGHIMSKFLPKDRLTFSGSTFEEYSNWVVATLNSVDFKSQAVDILITGNVYNKKATADFTGFPPFIAKRGEPLNFANSSLVANKQYFDFVNSQANPTPDSEGGSGAGASDSVKADF